MRTLRDDQAPRNLLFLACFFPPLATIGSVRASHIAKYLSRLGWRVRVVTPHPELWRNVEHATEVEEMLKQEGIERIYTGHRWKALSIGHLKGPNHGIHRLIGGVSRRLAKRLDIDRGIGWVPEVMKACENIKAADVDAILATASPYSAFIAAGRLAARLGRPYMLDYRDPWTDNPGEVPHIMQRTNPGRERKERLLLQRCSAASIISPSLAENLEARYHLGAKLHVITNGYDPEELASVEPCQFGHFAIVFTGTFALPKRPITPVFSALRLLTAEHRSDADWRFHYYGPHGSHVAQEAERFGIQDRVVLHGNVPRREALSAVRGAGVAVVVNSVYPEGTIGDRGAVSGKIFEPMGLGVRILMVAPPGNDAEPMIVATGAGRRFIGDDVDGIASFLADAMEGHLPSARPVEQYSWPVLAQRFDTILRGVVAAAD